MLLADLKSMAGGMGIKGAGSMKKAQLVDAIKSAQSGGQRRQVRQGSDGELGQATGERRPPGRAAEAPPTSRPSTAAESRTGATATTTAAATATRAATATTAARPRRQPRPRPEP